MGINMLDVKQANAQAVLWELWAHRAASVPILRSAQGLASQQWAASSLSLWETGEVILGDLVSGTGGRPSQAYVFNAEFAHVLAPSPHKCEAIPIRIRACAIFTGKPSRSGSTFAQISLESEAVAAALNAHPTIKGPGLCHTWRGAGWCCSGQRLSCPGRYCLPRILSGEVWGAYGGEQRCQRRTYGLCC